MLEHLYTALHSTHGIALECNDVTALRQRLYVERRAADDPDLDALSLVASPFNPRVLWIVKRQEPTP